MESFLTHWGYAAVFLFGFLEAACIPIPSEITFGFAGVLAGEGHLNIVAVIVVGTIAELLGSYVSYGVGRVCERPLVHRFGRYLLITQADIDRAERFLAGRGVWAIPVGRALPVVRTFVSIVAGFTKVPPLLFGVLSLIGTAVWVTVISLVGYGVGSAWQSVAHGLAVAGYVIFAVAVVGIAAFIAYRLREVRREAAEERGASEAGGPGVSEADGPGASETDGPGASETDGPGASETDGRGANGAHGRGTGGRRGGRHEAQPRPRSPMS
jgi:membrane protein DedA with SNARE-associated domain